MLIRYSKNAQGKPVRSAEVYTREEHKIGLEDIDPDALFVCRKLRQAGFGAYIVGGAVRDLLLGKRPKDFDIATSAPPRSVKRILPRSRIIGKRFRLVHAVFHVNKILEIATFRSDVQGDANVFGTLEEDVRRRDFTCNALYYDPKEEQVIDHVGGVRDIRRGRLANVLPLDTMFVEDPVRMLRAVKYAVLSGLKLGWSLGWKIQAQGSLLGGISPSRLTEEFYKILFSGRSFAILEAIHKRGLLRYFLPQLDAIFSKVKTSVKISLSVLDSASQHPKRDIPLERADAFYLLLEPLMEALGLHRTASLQNFYENIVWIKDFFQPIVPSNRECDESLRALFKRWNLRAPRPRLPKIYRREGEREGVDNEPTHEVESVSKLRRPRRRRRRKQVPPVTL